MFLLYSAKLQMAKSDCIAERKAFFAKKPPNQALIEPN